MSLSWLHVPVLQQWHSERGGGGHVPRYVGHEIGQKYGHFVSKYSTILHHRSLAVTSF